MWTETAKNLAVDSLPLNLLSLHGDDPGPDGLANEISGGGYARVAVTFEAGIGGVRFLSSDANFVGPALAPVAYIGIWDAAGAPTFLAAAPRTLGDGAFNSGGQYTVTTQTALYITDL